MWRWSPRLDKRGTPKNNSFLGCSVGPVDDKVYFFGGYIDYKKIAYMYHDKCPIEVRVFDTAYWEWKLLPPVKTRRGRRKVDVPCMRINHTAVTMEDLIYIWGGEVNCRLYMETVAVGMFRITHSITEGVNWKFEGDRVSVLYAYNVGKHTWFKPKVSGMVPAARSNQSACALGKVMYIHGGNTDTRVFTNDIYTLDTNTMVWSVVYTGGPPAPYSEAHSATMIGTKMFVFGGVGVGHEDNNLRVFDTQTHSWLSTPSAELFPERRQQHAAFVYDGELYIFGGGGVIQKLRKRSFPKVMWKLNPTDLSWKKVQPKGRGPDGLGDMHCCVEGDRIITFGETLVAQMLHFSGLRSLCMMRVCELHMEQARLPTIMKRELEKYRKTKKQTPIQHT